MKKSSNFSNSKTNKSAKSSPSITGSDHTQKEEERARIIAAIQRKFSETFAKSMQNEFFNTEKTNELSIKDIAYLATIIETMCQQEGLLANKIKTALAELVHPGIYLEKKLEELGDKDLIQELREKDYKTEKKLSAANAEIRALRARLELEDEAKSKSHAKWVDFAERNYEKKRNADDLNSSANKKVKPLDSSDEEALDDSAEDQQGLNNN